MTDLKTENHQLLSRMYVLGQADNLHSGEKSPVISTEFSTILLKSSN